VLVGGSSRSPGFHSVDPGADRTQPDMINMRSKAESIFLLCIIEF
jgi:hypothetical protein